MPASSVILRGRIAQGTCLIDAPARLIEAGTVAGSDTTYGRVTGNMLVALGYTPAEVTAIRDRSADPMPDAWFQNELKGARSDANCRY